MEKKFENKKPKNRRMVWSFPSLKKLQSGIFEDVNEYLRLDFEKETKKLKETKTVEAAEKEC